jgi:hypothetical protein
MTSTNQKDDHEQRIVELFCSWYQREHGTPCIFIKLASPPAPDAALQIDGQEIRIELARYREECPHNTLFPYDQSLKQAIFDRSVATPDLPHCTPILRYRERSREHYTIPRKPKYDQFIGELFDLVRRFAVAGNAAFIVITFVDDSRLAGYRRRINEARTYVANLEYPTLSRFCRAVTIHRHPKLRMGYPGSSMNSRGTAIDFNSITTTVTQKLNNLSSYRAAIGSQPLWLLYYSEGYPPTGRLTGPNYNEQVVSHIRNLCQAQTEQFDAVWWGDCMYAHGRPTVFRVV